MAVTNTPSGRALGRALRMAREENGLSITALSAQLGVGRSTISQWETASRIPDAESVARVLDALGVVGTRRSAILEYLAHSRETSRLAGISEATSTVIECERSATAIFEWSPFVVPGIVQVGEYARTILANPATSPQELSTRVSMRVGRREVVTHRFAPPVEFVIGEPALRGNIGGPSVMADQCWYLLEIADRPNVSIRVVLSDSGYHVGLFGQFTAYEFEAMPTTIFIEQHHKSTFLTEPDDVKVYHDAADDIRRVALSASDSRAFIAAKLKEYDERKPAK